jgi:hypothetical protein
MDADYSVDIGPTADALEIPWKDPDGRVLYVDLRGDPSSVEGNVERNIERIPEARQFPALRQFLIALNSKRSPWQTAKCDVWAEATVPEENIFSAEFAQGCYVDVVLAGGTASLRESLKSHQRLARKAALQLNNDEVLEATVEIVVRRCYFHHIAEMDESRDTSQDSSDDGYCLTLFLTGYGASPAEAADRWERALEMAAACLLELPLHEGLHDGRAKV